MMDKTEVCCRFRRSVDTYEKNAAVQEKIAGRLDELLAYYLEYSPARVLEIGCGTGFLTRKLVRRWGPEPLWINDLVEEMCRHTQETAHLSVEQALPGDIETIRLPQLWDLILSASTFQWLSEPALLFHKLSLHLDRGKLFIFSTFGPKNMYEIRSLTGQGLEYPDTSRLSAWLTTDFDILYREEACHTLHFAHPREVLQHLKRTGVTATATSRVWTPRMLDRFIKAYDVFLQEGKYPLTYHPYYFVCRRK